jgi:hypothetical protein
VGTYFRLVFFPYSSGDEVLNRFFFHVTDGQELRDETGMVLRRVQEAREEALLTASELLWRQRPVLEYSCVDCASD